MSTVLEISSVDEMFMKLTSYDILDSFIFQLLLFKALMFVALIYIFAMFAD